MDNREQQNMIFRSHNLLEAPFAVGKIQKSYPTIYALAGSVGGLPNSPHPFKAIISATLAISKAATRGMISI